MCAYKEQNVKSSIYLQHFPLHVRFVCKSWYTASVKQYYIKCGGENLLHTHIIYIHGLMVTEVSIPFVYKFDQFYQPNTPEKIFLLKNGQFNLLSFMYLQIKCFLEQRQNSLHKPGYGNRKICVLNLTHIFLVVRRA